MPVLLGDKEAGSDGVHADLVAVAVGQLHGHPAGEVIDGGFGHGVTQHPGDGGLGGHGRNIDDGTAVFGQVTAEYGGGQDGAVKVQVEGLLQGFDVDAENILV